MKRLMKKLAKCIAKKLGKSLKKKLVKSLIKRLKKSLEKKFGKRLGKKLGKKIGKKLENRFIKDKRGMTLMEIVVALTLLMLVIVFTTPVLLSSYGSLYTAGDYTKDTYEAKSEIEDTLATRNTLNVYENFKVNFESIGEIAEINGKRAVSSLYNSLETVFTGGRAHVAIISSKVINDDKITQTVVLQTTNVSFTSPDQVTSNCAHLNTITPNSVKKVDITAMLPDKSTDILSNIYNPGKYRATVKIVSANPETGRIIITVSDADFTMSPVKIMVTYLDENDKVKTTSCYLTIKTPSIMMAGTTNFGKKYYTTTGVETLTDDSGSKYTRLQVDGRVMRIDGASGTAEVPAGTVFKSVNWLTEYATGSSTGSNEDVEFVDSSYEPSYYVLTGTNGAIYRTYTFTNVNTIVGKVNLDTTDAPYSTGQVGKDVIGLTEKAYVLDDAQATTVYPATWSGDFSHIFGYSAYHKYMGYKGQNTWYTQTGTNTGIGQAGYFSNKAIYGYYFNGHGFNFDYNTQNSRKISYVLTEIPYALRVAGFMRNVGDFDQGFNRMWERPSTWNADDTFSSQKEDTYDKSNSDGWYYYDTGFTFPRCVAVKANANNDTFTDNYLNNLPVYFANNSSLGSDAGRWGDRHFAQLRVKALTTYSPTFLYEQRDNDDDSISSYKWVFNNTTNQSKVAVTDAIYLPSTATTSGGVFYIGTVAAYGVINQVDNGTTSENYAKNIHNNGDDNDGYQTSYYFMGNNEGTATSAYKYSSSSWGRDDANITLFQSKSQIGGAGSKANSNETKEFFVTRNYGGNSQILLNDVLFTMGYTSNREMVYSKIVYGKNESGALAEAFKSYEPLYFLSHYDDSSKNRLPNLYMNNEAATKNKNKNTVNSTNPTTAYLNSPDNDYYNVWFPGEMYNLTKVANKDGITVAVGYAVSGSTYTWINPNQSTNGSTGLGGLYNDGVLAAMVPGVSTSFTSLLYFKDTENFDRTYLTTTRSGSYNQLSGIGANVGYGTHQRDSVQFTAVDISVQYTTSGSTELASYYAYYADNKGRVFRSLVASKTTYVGSSSTPTLVSHISDKNSPTSTAPSYMQRIKLSDGSDFSDYFDKITAIKCQGDYIVISGHSRADLTKWNVAVGKVQSDGSVIFNRVSLDIDGAQPYQVEDMLILDGYVYFVGQCTADNKGWMYAHSLEDMASKSHNGLVTYNGNHFAGGDQIPDKIYAIDGHGTT